MCDVHGPLARRPPLFGGSRSRSSRGLLLLITSAGAPCFLNGSNEKVLTQGGARARRRRSQPASDPPPRGFGRPRGPGWRGALPVSGRPRRGTAVPASRRFPRAGLAPPRWDVAGVRYKGEARPLGPSVPMSWRTIRPGRMVRPGHGPLLQPKWGGLPHWLNRAPGFPGGGRGGSS